MGLLQFFLDLFGRKKPAEPSHGATTNAGMLSTDNPNSTFNQHSGTLHNPAWGSGEQSSEQVENNNADDAGGSWEPSIQQGEGIEPSGVDSTGTDSTSYDSSSYDSGSSDSGGGDSGGYDSGGGGGWN